MHTHLLIGYTLFSVAHEDIYSILFKKSLAELVYILPKLYMAIKSSK